MAVQLCLTPRQSELAAHLLAAQTLVGAARAMGISRHTANWHLTVLKQLAGTPDRQTLLVILGRVPQRQMVHPSRSGVIAMASHVL